MKRLYILVLVGIVAVVAVMVGTPLIRGGTPNDVIKLPLPNPTEPPPTPTPQPSPTPDYRKRGSSQVGTNVSAALNLMKNNHEDSKAYAQGESILRNTYNGIILRDFPLEELIDADVECVLISKGYITDEPELRNQLSQKFNKWRRTKSFLSKEGFVSEMERCLYTF